VKAPADAFRLTGTMRSEPPAIALKVGDLTAELAGGALRAIRYRGMEVLRAVSFLVRDRDWGTYDPDIEDLAVDPRADGFTVSYRTTCMGPAGERLSINAMIAADGHGRLTFRGQAKSDTGFETNRCGFCILHPILGLAGTPVRVEHVDGSIEETVLPDLIDPWQPFKDMRAITHQALPGVAVECRMEGDTFEMEDQRNWSDASYKTYVRPLALPWPYRIAPGETVTQTITLTIRAAQPGAATAVSDRAPIRLTPGPTSGRLPAIGLIVTPEEATATLALLGSADDPRVQDLIFAYDPLAGHDDTAFSAFAAIAARHGGTTTLEIALPCAEDAKDELRAIADAMDRAGFAPNAVVVSPAIDRQSTPPGSPWPLCPPLADVYAGAREVFPRTALGGGMLSYFTELNRKRVPAKTLDLITHCTNPIVHAADDRSVMQTLEALPFITRSVREIYGDMAYRIGPSTIPMRQNPYGSRTMDNPDNAGMAQRLPMAHRDPRHNALFGAAYAMGYAISVAPARLQQLTLSALTGPFGLVAGDNEPVHAGGRRPLFHVVALLAELGGAEVTTCASDRPDAVLGLTATLGDRQTTLVVNLTAEGQSIDLSALQLDARTRISCLNAETMDDAAGRPFAATVTADLSSGPLRLGPYAVMRIDS
jgi:hypothetical protein